MSKDLKAWLAYIEGLHPKSIAMGLDRVKVMIDRLQLHPRFPIITVAGTNGKGSTCAMLSQIYLDAGYQVACYSSPHLMRYNERVRINGIEAADEALCVAFSAVDSARLGSGEVIELTYFEVGTLAAMWHFMHAGIDVAVMEIGLGGRLDAVNAFEPSCTIVTAVDLDHQDFLGDTREKIAYEKAGIFRSNVPAICGDEHPPKSLMDYAQSINAPLKYLHQDFDFIRSDNHWRFIADDEVLGEVNYVLPLPALTGRYQLNNASCALAAVSAMQANLPVAPTAIETALQQVKLAGRFQVIPASTTIPVSLILDVAHNPHAAIALADNLNHCTSSKPAKTVAVFAMLADKDVKGVVSALVEVFDVWYVAGIDHARGALPEDLAEIIHTIQPSAQVKTFIDAAQAYQQACLDLKATNTTESCIQVNENDKIVVFGSFYTVSNVMQVLYTQSKS
jgi:dihydrofolate synthase/folylpolyglutamate synthase